MTFSQFKKLLFAYPEMTEKVYCIRKEIEEAKTAVETIRDGTSGNVISGMPRGNRVSDSTYTKAQKIVDVYDMRINKLLEEVQDVQELQFLVTDLLKGLSPDEYKVIKARYLDGVGWDYIPGRVNYSRKHCFRLHDRAISKLLRKFKDDTK